MKIEPQTVEPGFVKRWTVQAIALAFRSPAVWGIVLLLYFLTSRVIDNSILHFFIGGFLLMLSLEFACLTDFKKMSLNDFISCFKVTTKNYIEFINSRKFFLIAICVVMLLLQFVLKAPTPKDVAAGSSVQDVSMFASMMFNVIFGYIFLNNGGSLQIFTYPLKRAFDSNESEAISATCLRATAKNPKVFIFFEGGVFFSMIIIGAIFPITAIFFSIFIPCLIYVAFREIFWGTKENQKQEEQVSEMSSQMKLVKIND